MEVLQDGNDNSGSTPSTDDNNILITLAVSLDQEMAIRTFFQVNEWPLIEGVKHLEMVDKEGGTRLMTLRVTPEQEIAMEAFFQINNWALIKEAETAVTTVTEILENVEETINDDAAVIPAGSTLEEVTVNADDMEIQVSSDGSGKQQQVIFYKNGEAHLLPSIILGDGGKNLSSQIVVQEISLPEARNLESLVIGNTNQLPRKVTPRGTMKPGDKIHKCHVCGKTFKQSPSFNGHYQSHFGNKPHHCSICGTGFTLKAALVAHQSIHTGEKPFQCTVCLKRFRRKDDLISHIRTHTGEKPYECELCGKKFKYRNQIPKHMRGHTGDKPYKCSHCEKAFTSNIHLKRHERTHTGERPYKCEFCTKAFTQYGHLQAHIRIHTNERPYKCSICGRGFREKKVLKKHESLHTSERPYKCEVCGKGFLRQSNMELHSVMHQKGREGAPKVRPRPKKKRTADAAMMDFVSRVLTSVEKVETGMQTENFNENIKEENTAATDNLAAFVDFAVSTQGLEQQEMGDGAAIYQDPNVQIDTIPDNMGNQYTLVLPEDGSEGYLIAVDQAQEQIVSTEPEINNLPTAEELNQQVVNATHVSNTSSTNSEEFVSSDLVTEAINVVNNNLEETGNVGDVQATIVAGEADNNQNTNLTNLENVSLGSVTLSKTDEITDSQEFGTLDFSALNPDASSSTVVQNQVGSVEQDRSDSQILSEGGQIHVVK